MASDVLAFHAAETTQVVRYSITDAMIAAIRDKSEWPDGDR